LNLSLAYIVLAHEGAEQIAGLVRTLVEADPTANVVVHYDRNASKSQFSALRQALQDHDRVWLVEDRARCGWGQFGLVDGVVRALRVLRAHKIDCDYVYLLSGSCMPTKPLASLKAFLDQNRGLEFIEVNSPDWIVSGLREERYEYRHWFSFRTEHLLFESSYRTQRALRLKRRLPKRLSPRFGSQWWCLTYATCNSILEFIDANPRAYRFFKTTWIPDELFFQTMVASIVPAARIYNRSLTLFKFTWKGRPLTFFDDHLDLVPRLPHFFARKIGAGAHALRAKLAEIAAAPAESERFSALPLNKGGFDIAERVSAQVDRPRPGQLFYGGQTFCGWPSSFAQSQVPFVVLHGPPAVTQFVREHFKRARGFTLLGRVFNPGKVDLADLGDGFRGFTPDDVKIRDMDPPLYLSRLLDRAEGVPVIEICPGDIPHAEGHFLYNDRALFVSLQPSFAADERSRRLYWLLAAIANPACDAGYLPSLAGAGDHRAIQQRIDAFIERFTGEEHRLWVNEAVLGADRARRCVRLTWNAGGRKPPPEPWDEILSQLGTPFAKIIRPLETILAKAEAELASLRPFSLTASLPSEWRRHFSAGAGANWESWDGVLGDSPVGYGVLHGPPAMTRVVREHLRHIPGVAMLGRVFDPKADKSLLDGKTNLGLDESDLELRECDPPLFLARLFARAEGFPVIEVCPGDEPVGEGYFLSDANAVFISCQPERTDTETWRRLYWALAAAADVRDIETAETRDAASARSFTGARERRAQRQIDAFILRNTPLQHRNWLSERLFRANPGPSFLRLVCGGRELSGAGGSLAGDLEKLRRNCGAAVTPLVRGLGGIGAELAVMRPANLTRALPPDWREYFSMGAGATWESWEGVFGNSAVGYGVLHGPPTLTHDVREHLRRIPGVAMLGRVFDRRADRSLLEGDASLGLDEDDLELRKYDRPLFLARLFARTEGFPVIEVCPGDEPIGEGYFLGDANAVFVSCQPARTDNEEWRRLYWALAAAANPASDADLARHRQNRVGPLKASQQIEAFTTAFTVAEHRKWVEEAILDKRPSGAFVRLAVGGGGASRLSDSLTPRLAEARRLYGAKAAPLLRRLAELEAEVGGVSLWDSALELPSAWREVLTNESEAANRPRGPQLAAEQPVPHVGARA
jgi:hypothetical protein